MYHLFEHSLKLYPNVYIYGKRVFLNGKWQDRFEFINRIQFRELRDSVGSFLT